MNVREYRPSDLEELERIHNEFFSEEFSLPDFLTNYLCAVTIEDDAGVITIGGVRNIAESVIVTNKERSAYTRVRALNNLLEASRFIARTHGHDQLHAFIQDDKWYSHLLEKGFAPCKGRALVTGV